MIFAVSMMVLDMAFFAACITLGENLTKLYDHTVQYNAHIMCLHMTRQLYTVCSENQNNKLLSIVYDHHLLLSDTI